MKNIQYFYKISLVAALAGAALLTYPLQAMEDSPLVVQKVVQRRTPWPAGTPSGLATLECEQTLFREGKHAKVAVDESLLEKIFQITQSLLIRYAKSNPTLVFNNFDGMVRLANACYVPAVLLVSEAFRDGKYGMPENKWFADHLLELLHIDDEVVRHLDGHTVRYILNKCRERHPTGFTLARIREDLAPDVYEGIFSNYIHSASDGWVFETVAQNFKKPGKCAKYIEAAFGKEVAVEEEREDLLAKKTK